MEFRTGMRVEMTVEDLDVYHVDWARDVRELKIVN
jgi:hypothetical protein